MGLYGLRSNEGASRHVNKNGEIQKRASTSPPYWFLDYKSPKIMVLLCLVWPENVPKVLVTMVTKSLCTFSGHMKNRSTILFGGL